MHLKICEWLPIVIYSLNQEKNVENASKNILQELQENYDNQFIDSIFKLSYPTYMGFDELNIRFNDYIPNI